MINSLSKSDDTKYFLSMFFPNISRAFSWMKMVFILLSFNISQKHTRAFLVAQMVKNPPAIQETWVQFLGWEDPLEEGMATHSDILAWRVSWTEEVASIVPHTLKIFKYLKNKLIDISTICILLYFQNIPYKSQFFFFTNFFFHKFYSMTTSRKF